MATETYYQCSTMAGQWLIVNTLPARKFFPMQRFFSTVGHFKKRRMKSAIIFSLFLLILVGCDKAEETFSATCAMHNGTKVLKGSWELRDIQGGFRQPRSAGDYLPGNGTGWQFQDSTYRQFYKGAVVEEGQFTRFEDTAIATGRIMDGVRIKSLEIERELFYEFNQDTLVVYEGHIAWDGTISKYV